MNGYKTNDYSCVGGDGGGGRLTFHCYTQTLYGDRPSTFYMHARNPEFSFE